MSQNQERIVLQPDYIDVQKENGRLIIIRKNRNFVLSSIFVLILAGIFYTLTALGYMKILNEEADARSDYRSTIAREITALKEQHLSIERNRREEIQRSYSRVNSVLSTQKFKIIRADLSAQSSGDSTELNMALNTLDSLKKQEKQLGIQLKQLSSLGELKAPSDAELSEEIKALKIKNQYLREVPLEEYLKIGIVMGLMFLIGSLLLFAIPYSSGNDCWTIDKNQEEIRFTKNRFRKVKITPTSNIKQFYCIQTGGEYSRVLLKYIDFENKEQLFIRRLASAQEGIFIEQQIENFLEIEDIPIAGSIR